MKKKFLSAILFGALLASSTETFVSCKDYYDDISGLQEQIDGQKSDLTAKVSAVESSINSLQTAQSSLQSAISSAKSDAEKAALEAQNQAIETAKAELEKVKAELQEAIKASAGDMEAVKEAVKKAEDEMSKIKGRIEALEAFKTTTEEALKSLTEADDALNSSISNLNKEMEALGVRLTAVEGQIAALESYKTSNDAAVQANKAAIDQLIEDLNALQEGQLTEGMLEGIAAEVAELLGEDLNIIRDALLALHQQVTHISLFSTAEEWGNMQMQLVSEEAVRTWTFGEDMAGDPVSFVKDNKETYPYTFLVRVSPTNADLDASMIRLVNSQMNDLDGLLEVTDVRPYEGLLTRSVSPNGLWQVTVKLVDNWDQTAYNDAAYRKVNGRYTADNILYAVMVGDNDEDGVDDRQVVSEYGLYLADYTWTKLRELNFSVDDTPVDEIKNRWSGAAPTWSENGGRVDYEEKTWNLNPRFDPWAEPVFTSSNPANINVQNDAADARSWRPAFSVRAGQTFTVTMNGLNVVRAAYITLDEDCAMESAPSELNAWKSYNIQGLNTVVRKENCAGDRVALNLTIPENANADGDYIGFRVYAVNYDGSLVDPDGKAFYVYVGETAQTAANLTLTVDPRVVVPLATTVKSARAPFSTAGWSRAQGGRYTITVEEVTEQGRTNVTARFPEAYFVFRDNRGNVVGLLDGAGNLIGTNAISTVTTVEIQNVPATDMKDGVTYTATITAMNTTSGIVAVSTINFTKQLPGFPTDVYPFTNILVDGNLKIYPTNNAGTAEYDLNNAWHGISAGGVGNASLTFAEIAQRPTVSYNRTTNVVSVPGNLVNPADRAYGTRFPMQITYNYGPISNAWDTNTELWTVRNLTRTWGTPFTIEFSNYIDDCVFAWNGSAPTVHYPGAVGQPSYIALSNLRVTDWYNQAVDLTKMTTAGTKENTYMRNVQLHFLTGADFREVDEYYACVAGAEYVRYSAGTYTVVPNISTATHIRLVSQSNAAQGADVPTKIQLVFTDNFGYTVTKVIDTPFNMTFQQ